MGERRFSAAVGVGGGGQAVESEYINPPSVAASEECIRVLKDIAETSNGDWHTKLHTTIDWDIDLAASSVRQLYNCAILCYFIDRTPLLPEF